MTIGRHKQLYSPITPILIIILTVRNINHLTKHNNDDHHINNNHNNLLTVRFHHVITIRDHYQITDDNKTLLFVPITSKRSNKKSKPLHHYMRKHLHIPPLSQNNRIFRSRKYPIGTTYFMATTTTMWFHIATQYDATQNTTVSCASHRISHFKRVTHLDRAHRKQRSTCSFR